MEVINQKSPREYRVHKILAHSYAVFFIFFLASVMLDIFFPIKIFASAVAMPFGLGLLVIATIVVFWAQKTSRNLDIKNLSKETFCKGPYCYSRHPTHWGLLLLMLGFGIITNAFFVILFTIIAFIVTKFIFIEKQEAVLAEKYGAPYLEYKKSIKF